MCLSLKSFKNFSIFSMGISELKRVKFSLKETENTPKSVEIKQNLDTRELGDMSEYPTRYSISLPTVAVKLFSKSLMRERFFHTTTANNCILLGVF